MTSIESIVGAASYYTEELTPVYSEAAIANERKFREKLERETAPDPSKYHLDTKLGQARYALDCWYHKETCRINLYYIIEGMKGFPNWDEQLTIHLKMLGKLYNQKAEAMGIYPYNENKLTTIVS